MAPCCREVLEVSGVSEISPDRDVFLSFWITDFISDCIAGMGWCRIAESLSLLLCCYDDNFLRRSATILTGDDGVIGRWPSHDVSLLGAIIFSVMTSLLTGQTPVFRKAVRIRFGVSA